MSTLQLHRSPRTTAFLLGILALVISGPASRAQSIPTYPERLLLQCLADIDQEAEDALAGIEAVKTEALARLDELRASGASAKILAKSAKTSKRHLGEPARSAAAEINRLTGTCMIQLRRLGAGRGLTNPLLAARADAFKRMKQAIKDAAAAIDAAAAAPVATARAPVASCATVAEAEPCPPPFAT